MRYRSTCSLQEDRKKGGGGGITAGQYGNLFPLIFAVRCDRKKIVIKSGKSLKRKVTGGEKVIHHDLVRSEGVTGEMVTCEGVRV